MAQQVRPKLGGRIVWRTGLAQPAKLRPRRGPGKARLGRGGAANRTAAEQTSQPARTDTGEFLPGEAQPSPEGPHDATAGSFGERTDHSGRKRQVVRVAPYAERGGRGTTGPALPGEGSERAGKTWDWFVNTTCWDWYANSSGRADRGDADE
ncbi:hypothetical protein ACIRRA_19560 [Nocardia sp. NPDC101769]|uniref:hypothetical protein n=1 Tax=Nocardia sp. NPDC101769 TaxID=3364333 RepID=UPI0038273F7C